MAAIADRAGVDMVSVGDSVGTNLWGRSEEAPVTIAEMLIVCKAVRRGVKRALLFVRRAVRFSGRREAPG